MEDKKKKIEKKKIEKEVDPNSFYEEIDGVYNHPKKDVSIKIKRSLEDIRRKKEAEKIINQEKKPTEVMPPEFNPQEYKKRENKKLEDLGANVKVYSKSSHETLLIILIGVLVVFGLFFVWGVSNDKFKTDFTCPDCNCPQALLSCPNIEQPDCVCNQTLSCPEFNDTSIIDAINNLNMSNSTGGS